MILESFNNSQVNYLLDKAAALSKEFRETTSDLVGVLGWYNLLRNTEGDVSLRQALGAWKIAVKKIGKGHGKHVSRYRKEAREAMKLCQRAVPVWIMPLNRALNQFNPTDNSFDVVILDEASQSTSRALAALFLGKKVIVVGDDRQVSPLGVGVDLDEAKAISDMYLKDIPGAGLFEPRTSIYDIASMTYKPILLREHFRCVPQIIGYSNKYSYDNKIKPLRDATALPLYLPVINHFVGGTRDDRQVNLIEATKIVALIKACSESPAYESKRFGIITLLGTKQKEEILKQLYRRLTIAEIEERDIKCGNAYDFQGDERHVIFLSMVDSPDANGPLNLRRAGVEDRDKKRYNVAVSRAKDQLWVVNSLNYKTDLKPNDIRRELLEYSSLQDGSFTEEGSSNPKSGFVAKIAEQLTKRGYKVKPSWEVGIYTLDMVVLGSNKKIAIQCDGDAVVADSSQVEEIVERQTVLERMGWEFIHVSALSYYQDPKQTIDLVCKKLAEQGIDIESGEDTVDKLAEHRKVLAQAQQYFDAWVNEDLSVDEPVELSEVFYVPGEIE